MSRGAFLRTRLHEMDLPEETKRGLYRIGVDCIADLLQVTEEELMAAEREKGYDAKTVKDYLARHRHHLRSYARRTSKVSLNRPSWMIPLPGAPIAFSIERPSLEPEWFSVYYRRSGHFDGEKDAGAVFAAAPPPILQEGRQPNDYQEFFQIARRLFDSYEQCCSFSGIEPLIPRPAIPQEDVRLIYREGVRAVVDILSRTPLLKHGATAGEYFCASDERKLNIAEVNSKPECFQELLLYHVELKLDIENIVIYLEECIREMNQQLNNESLNNAYMSLFNKKDSRHGGEDDEFERLLASFMAEDHGEDWMIPGIDQSDDDDPDEEKESKTESVVCGGGYRICCDVDDNPAEIPVEGLILCFRPEEGQYLHVDIELPDVNEECDLLVSISTQKSAPVFKARFDRKSIPLFRDGNRLHVAPIDVLQLFDPDYRLSESDTDEVQISLSRNAQVLGRARIEIQGPWPEVVPAPVDRLTGIVEDLSRQQGWDNFKARMGSMLTRSQVGNLRDRAGFDRNLPRLHTAIVGNPGTGKTSAVEHMVRLYTELGLLKTDSIRTTRVSSLATSGINTENEAVLDAVESIQGGTLVIDGAHELYKTDNRGNYDTESRIVRALVDCLNNREKYRCWMLVLVGEPEGMESLLSRYPELKKCLSEPIYMEDFKPAQLFRMFDMCCTDRKIKLSDDARRKLEMYVLHKYNRRGPSFGNAWLVQNLFDDDIIPAMFNRLRGIDSPTKEQLEMVLPEDIPSVGEQKEDAQADLDELIGLGTIKTKVRDYLHAIRLARRRMEMGLPTNMPRLHMAFLGNPGTGKTTVAEIIGRVFASWGILSGGRVIRTEKSQMVGQWIGETEFKMTNLLARARGNILFIDEAYQLEEGGERDHGRIVMNSLLTELGKENLDMVVILAGYTAPMKRLLESNEGIESRFPNVFNFEDYTTDELLEIGKLMIRKQGFTLTEGAQENMRVIIQEESDKPSPRFGNGRFVSNLLQNEILATLGARTAKLENPTPEDLSTILPEDVVIGKAQKDVVFDDVAIDAALARLDSLAGLDGVKKAVHNFVRSARYLHSIGEPYVGKGLLCWRFIGKSGTGKSTVAEIMAQILRGMRLIANSHITDVKGERIFGVTEYNCDRVLQDAVKRACNGLIFIDVDDPKFLESRADYVRYVELIRLKVKELTVEAGGEGALILAELESPNAPVSEQLYESGIYEFDHTLVFKDFSTKELYQILCHCLEKFKVTFSEEAEKHMLGYLDSMVGGFGVNARTMKLLSRSIYQQVVLRESALAEAPARHLVELADIETFKWNVGKRGKIGF